MLVINTKKNAKLEKKNMKRLKKEMNKDQILKEKSTK